tara:strand:+ start:1466 stop:2560 length:1095 start_codon:yes stop_codon:yes gene_type:complete
MDQKIALIGDVALNGLHVIEKENNIKRYSEISKKINNNVLSIINLETPLADGNERNKYKNIHFYTHVDVLKEYLLNLNTKIVSLANNHIGDCGYSGLKKTIETLDDLGILHTGAGLNKGHIEPIITKINNKNIGFLAYVDKNTNPKVEKLEKIYINYFEEKKVISDINKIKKDVDILILSIHWGIDYSYYPTNKQIHIARNLNNQGVDIIMGHHTHTFQPFEEINKKFIFYSLGGITFGDHYDKGKLKSLPKKTKYSGIPILEIKENIVLKEIIPIIEKKGNYIKLHNIDYNKINKIRWRNFNLMNKNRVIKFIVEFKENYFDRIYEFIFGYYKNSFIQIFRLINLNKFIKMIHDARIKKNRVY